MEILKENLFTSSNLLEQFVDINFSYFSFSVNDLLWYIEGSKIYFYYVINHEFAIDFLVDKYFSASAKLCFF
jgi:hypothetical protein